MLLFRLLMVLILLGTPLSAGNAPAYFPLEKLLIFPEQTAGHLTKDYIVKAIEGAQHTLWLCVYHIDDPDILKAVLQAAKRGVDVKMIIEGKTFGHDYTTSKGLTVQELISQMQVEGGQVRVISGEERAFAQTHYKMMMVDDIYAVILTVNFDKESLVPGADAGFPMGTRDFGYVVEEESYLQELKTVFLNDWEQRPSLPKVEQLVWGPEDQRSKILRQINAAKVSIQIYQQALSDEGVTRALLQALKRQVKVQLIMMPNPFFSDKDNNRESQEKLVKAGAELHFFPNDKDKPHGQKRNTYFQHAKAMMVDGNVLLMTSCNFYSPSLDVNRELGIFITEPAALNLFKATFNKDWQQTDVAFSRGGK